VPFFERDQLYGPHIEQAAALIQSGEFHDHVAP
jgi:hypothetical protein